MSKVQTFEEWWESDGQMRHSLSFKDSMEAAWQAAMENAARVCDDLDLGRPDGAYQEGFNDGVTEAAQTIREAAKR